jgi:predicted RNA-binding Zn-ribbon protein involved in translation (DUF1610 family)
MSVYKLVLYPQLDDAVEITEQQLKALIQTLRQIGFIDPERVLEVDGSLRYLLGDACLSQLTFLGCSPHIELEPPAVDAEEAARRGAFCHLTVTRFDEPRWRVDPTARPRCPACRATVASAELSIQDELTCPRCGETRVADSWNWRNLAGRSRLFLDIWGVFTSEAVPNPPLLQALAAAVEAEWKYFYVKD